MFCPAAHPALLTEVQIAAAVVARQHYNDLHTTVWHARATWERALRIADAANQPCSQALAHAQVVMDTYRPVLLQALHRATVRWIGWPRW